MSNHSHIFGVNLNSVIGAILIATSICATTSLANAQQPAENAAPASVADTIDEAKLDKFVSAYIEVLRLQKEANEKRTSTTDPDANQALASETQRKMTDAVQRSGLQIDEFNQIAQQMLTDEDLRSRIAAKIQVRNSSGG